MAKRALVTGASGFIGSTLVEELGRRGYDVHALLRTNSPRENLKNSSFKPVAGDLSDLDSLRAAVRGMDFVFHLAGATSSPTASGYFRQNAEGSAKLATAIKESGQPGVRVVYVSSLAAAGPSDSLAPRCESEKERPVSAYGESKLQGEREFLKYQQSYHTTIIRPPLVYGPKDKQVLLFIKTVSKNFMPILVGANDLKQKYYSVVYVADLCEGIVQAADASSADIPSGEVFYLADDSVVTYETIMSTIANQLGKRPFRVRVPNSVIRVAALGASAVNRFTKKPLPLTMDKVNELLPDYWICSNQKAKEKLGFAPRHDLKRGFATTIDWYVSNRWI